MIWLSPVQSQVDYNQRRPRSEPDSRSPPALQVSLLQLVKMCDERLAKIVGKGEVGRTTGNTVGLGHSEFNFLAMLSYGMGCLKTAYQVTTT